MVTRRRTPVWLLPLGLALIGTGLVLSGLGHARRAVVDVLLVLGATMVAGRYLPRVIAVGVRRGRALARRHGRWPDDPE